MGMSAKEEQNFKECFEMYDEEGEGIVKVSKLPDMLTLLGWNPTQADTDGLIKQCGFRATGNMDKNDFLRAMSIYNKPKHTEAELKEAFQVFDKDGSGYIEWEELKFVMQGAGEPLTDEEVKQMMTEADKDGDGRIDYEEFVAMMTGDDIGF